VPTSAAASFGSSLEASNQLLREVPLERDASSLTEKQEVAGGRVRRE